MFCFFPCEEKDTESNYEQLWERNEHRKTGSCSNGLKVMVFDSSRDYSEYLTENLNKEQLSLTKNILNENLDRFFIKKIPKTKYLDCSNEFLGYKQNILNNFEKVFLKDEVSNVHKEDDFEISKDENQIQENNSKTKEFLSKAKNAVLKFVSIFT